MIQIGQLSNTSFIIYYMYKLRAGTNIKYSFFFIKLYCSKVRTYLHDIFKEWMKWRFVPRREWREKKRQAESQNVPRKTFSKENAKGQGKENMTFGLKASLLFSQILH